MAVRHLKVNSKSDPADTSLVRPSDWNADHTVEGAVELVIDGSGSTITSGIKADIVLPYDGTFTSWTLLADVAGSIVIDLWLEQYVDYPPTVADTITASAKPTLSSASKATSSTLTGWTTAFTAGDVLRVYVQPTPATVTRVLLSLGTLS
jgi:hypothetical protein